MGKKKIDRDIALKVLAAVEAVKDALVDFLESPNIIYQPKDWYGNIGDTVTFSVTAINVTGYRWQYSNDGGATWNNSSASVQGYNTDTMSFTMEEGLESRYRRCRLTLPEGGYIYTNSVRSFLIENEGG